MAEYGHAWLLAARCARGCKRHPVCRSERYGLLICVNCAVQEDEEDNPNPKRLV